MLRSKKFYRTLLLAALVMGALGLGGCHMIGAHGSLYLGHGGHHGGHSRYQTAPSYGHQQRPQRPRPSRHSHSTGRHYRH